MGSKLHIFMLAFPFLGLADCGELAPLSFIPQELVSYFHPESLFEQNISPGYVERQRRALSNQDQEDEKDDPFTDLPNTFVVSSNHLDEGGKITETKCMMIRTRVKIEVRYRMRPTGVGSRVYTMPEEPDKVNGTCALETETARMFIFWPGFNLTFVFTKNPEGNSYYMDKAVVVYDKSHPALRRDFANAQSGGRVKLETIPDRNFFWTPLGKSFSCQEAVDQGPLKLFNVVDDEIEGRIELSDTRFQPFVKRAGGVWGQKVECLPRSIRDVRDTMPFICASLVLLISGLTVAGYGIQRTFFPEQKVGYDTYGEERHEMKQVVNPEDVSAGPSEIRNPEQPIERKIQPPAEATTAAPSSNPFKNKAANPFQTYGST